MSENISGIFNNDIRFHIGEHRRVDDGNYNKNSKTKTKCTNRKELKKVYQDEKERKGRKNYDQRTKHENNQRTQRENKNNNRGIFPNDTLWEYTTQRREKNKWERRTRRGEVEIKK